MKIQFALRRSACAALLAFMLGSLAVGGKPGFPSNETGTAIFSGSTSLALTIYPTNANGQEVKAGLVHQHGEASDCDAFIPASAPEMEILAGPVPPAGDGALVNYRSFDGSNYLMRQFLGKYTAVLIKPHDLDNFGVTQARELLDIADLYYAADQEFYGLEPHGSGLLRVAFVKNCGAGCGYVGSRGVEIDPGYVNEPSDTVAEILGVLGHEMNHNFDRFSSYMFIGPDIAHTWNDVVDSYARLVDRSGSRTRTPEDNVRNALDSWLRPYEDYPGSTWESCILNAACPGVSVQHSQGGMVLRLAQLLGVPATQQSLRKLRYFVETRGLSGSSMTANQKADLILESFSYGAGTNLACYYEAMRWPVSAGLRSQLAAAFGTGNSLCVDADSDTFSVIKGDLDDGNPNVFPGAVETANGLDDDCNFIVDDLLFTETSDFPGSANTGFALPLPARARGALSSTSDADFFYINLGAQTKVRFTLRSVDNTFRGWLFLYNQSGGWRNYFYVGAGSKGDMTLTLDPGRWNFGVEINNASTPGAYEVIVQTAYDWPVLVYPAAPQNLASNLWRLSSPPVPAGLNGLSDLRARFWVTGCGWVSTNAVPSASGVTSDWLAPVDLDLRQTGYRAQFFIGDFAAERVSEAAPFITNAPPIVHLTSPTNASSFLVGANVTVSADIIDPESELRWANLYMDNTLLITLTNGPFTVTVSNLAGGSYVFKAVATDVAGATVASASARVIVSPDRILIAPGAEWKFFDKGVDQGIAWRALTFNDTGWSNGPAQLGYGDDDEATVVYFGSDPNNKYITTYFRHSFELAETASITNLAVSLLRDDGGVVYLNGTEIFRDNMPSGSISFPTPASAGASAADETTNFHSIGVSPALLRVGTNVVAVEIHQENSGSSDISFDLMLVAGATNQPPVVAITTPADGVVLTAPAMFALSAAANDPDGVLTKLELFRGTIKVGERTSSPLSISQSSLPIGSYTFWARATDQNGAISTSGPVMVFVVSAVSVTNITTGERWKYLDDGSDQAAAWRSTNFDDSSWREGRAQLGYGDGDEITTVRSNRLDGTRIITTYFRRAFVVDDPSLVRGLTARLLRDDGAVVYLNGTEVWRDNMPTNPITYTTTATNGLGVPEETTFYTHTIDETLLRPNTNVIAVEIHQVSTSSSDISFDFELRGMRVNPTPAPLAISAYGGGFTILWPAPAVGLRLYGATNLTPPIPWTLLPTTPVLSGGYYSVSLPATNSVNKFYRLQYP